MVEAGRPTTEISQGRVLWRPRQEEQIERAVPPWADPQAQPPPPPPSSSRFVATLSPPPQRRSMMKPASPLSSATEVSPNPTHFNRPTPGASPVMARRSLFRNNAAPSRARSVDSPINRAPPWADHQLRPTHRTDSPSRGKGKTGALSPPPAAPPATSASPSATTSAHTPGIQSTPKTSSGSGQKATVDSASTSTTRTVSSKTVVSSTELRRVEMKEEESDAQYSSEKMTKTPVVSADSASSTSRVGVVGGKLGPPDSTAGQGASDGHPKSRQAQVTSRQQTGTAGMQSAAGTMVSTRSVTEDQAAPPPALTQEKSSPTPWRKNRAASAKDAPTLTQSSQSSSQCSHDVSAASGAIHHTITVVQEGKAEEETVQSAPWRRQVTAKDQKTPPPATVPPAPSPAPPPPEAHSSTPPPPQPASEGTESQVKGKSGGSKATEAQPSWRKQRPKGRQTPPPASSTTTVATTTSQPQAASSDSRTAAPTQATNTSQVGAIPTQQAKSLTSSVSAISQESSVTATTVSVQKQAKASLETSVEVTSTVPSVSTSTASVTTRTKQSSSESKVSSSVSAVSNPTKTPSVATSVTAHETKTAHEANKRVEEAVREQHLLASKSERGAAESVVVCDAKRATPTSPAPTSAAPPASTTPPQQPRPTEALSSASKNVVGPPPPPAPQPPPVTPPTSSGVTSTPVPIQTTDKASFGVSVEVAATTTTTTTPSMPIPALPPAPDAKQLKSAARSPLQQAASPAQQGACAGEGVEKGVAIPQPSPAGQETADTPAPAVVDPDLPPPPPTLLQEEKAGAASTPHSLQLPTRGAGETDVPSPDYVRESVTKRIKAFEKQASFDDEPPLPLDRHLPPARPVAPWVKKTSSGPVQQESYWSATSPEEQETPLPPPPPPAAPSRPKTDRTMSPSRPPPNREPPKAAPAPAASPRVVPSSAVKASGIPKHLQQHQHVARQRSASTGDYIANYITPDFGNSRMPAEGGSGGAPELTPPPPPTTPSSGKEETLFDPWCDPKNPRVLNFQDVSAAAFKIKSGIMNTPCTRSHLSSLTDMEIFFKKEFNQYTGSFKERGARYTLLMLSEEQQKKGVIAASAGNHALALCYHGQDLGIPVTVVMPLVAPIMKVQACRQYGANIIVKGNDIGECREYALKMAKEQGLLYINGYDHPHILAGQGTMGLEIVEQVPNIDAVVIPVGGAGLIAGVALAVKALYPHVKVIGVESERCASFSAAMKAGRPVYVKAESTLADGLAVPMVGVNAFATARNLVDKVVSVKEEWIAISILRLVETEKAVVEGAGATALAAILAGELQELKGKRVVIPLCGGNIDTTVLGRCLERGLAADGRLVKFTVTVSDRPGGIAELTRLLANLGVSIKDMVHERAWIRSDIFSVEVKVMAETRDHDHWLELKSALEARYHQLRFAMPDIIH